MRISDWSSDVCSSDLEDQDIVIVERFGTAFGPVDPQGATDLVDDRGLVDDLRTARGRKRDTLLRLAGNAAFEQLGKLGFGFELFARGGGGSGRYGRGGDKRRNEVTHGSTPVFIIPYPEIGRAHV